MAKSQKRGNREKRKPKVAKPATPAATTLTQGMLTPVSIGLPKKKG